MSSEKPLAAFSFCRTIGGVGGVRREGVPGRDRMMKIRTQTTFLSQRPCPLFLAPSIQSGSAGLLRDSC
jgi:hypothetical protein